MGARRQGTLTELNAQSFYLGEIAVDTTNSPATMRMLVANADGLGSAVLTNEFEAEVIAGFPITAPADSAAAPSYSYAGDLNTGIFSGAADTLGLSTGGTARLTATNTALTSSVPNRGAAGTAAAPTWSFSGDTDTGVFSAGANTLGLSLGGVNRVNITTADFQSLLNISTFAGTAADPAFELGFFSGHGLYPAAGGIGFTVSGVSVGVVIATGWFPAVATQNIDGSAAAPSYTFATDSTTGLYLVGAATLGFTAGGAGVGSISSTAWSPTVPVQAGDGTAAAPSYSFASSPNAGIYRIAANRIGISSASTEIVRIQPEGAEISQVVQTSGTPSLFLVTGAAHTGLTANTEAIDFDIRLGRAVQFTAGAGIAVQRASVFRAPTYAATAAETITTAATLAITGAPAAGANMTLTNSYALWVQAGAAAFAGPLLAADGSAAAPSYSFASDPDTGFYSAGADSLGIAAGGFSIGSLALTAWTAGVQIRGISGIATIPSFAFSADTNTGMWNPAADTIAFQTNGVDRMQISNAGIDFSVGANSGGAINTEWRNVGVFAISTAYSHKFIAKNSTPVDFTYCALTHDARTVVAAAEDGRSRLQIAGGGTLRDAYEINFDTAVDLHTWRDRLGNTLMTLAAASVLTLGGDVALSRSAANILALASGDTVLLQTDRSIRFDSQTSSAGASAGTLANAPAAGDPGFWLKINIGGVNYAIPCWAG